MMKRFFYDIYLLLIALIFIIEPVNALSFQMEEGTAIIIYIFCGLFIFTGIVLIIISKINKGSTGKIYYEEEHNNQISGLIDKKDDKKEENNFNSDSIFKILPSFSKNNFFNTTYEELKNKTSLDDCTLKNKKIIDFREETDKYVITSQLTFERKIENEKNKSQSIETSNYVITSIKEKNINSDCRCPNCGGKIKDITKLRCQYCGSILPPIDSNNTSEWQIEKFEK